jgi:hypothetical protein
VKRNCAGGKRPVAAAVTKKRKNAKHVVYAISAPTQPQSKPAAISPRHSFTKEITGYAVRNHLVSTASILFIFCFIASIESDTTVEGI